MSSKSVYFCHWHALTCKGSLRRNTNIFFIFFLILSVCSQHFFAQLFYMTLNYAFCHPTRKPWPAPLSPTLAHLLFEQDMVTHNEKQTGSGSRKELYFSVWIPSMWPKQALWGPCVQYTDGALHPKCLKHFQGLWLQCSHSIQDQLKK